ncbi:MAG: carbohydrate-binding family 9-like protein [Oscillospiraceae bacterium]|nr:carbohydrate-binding family 9-like protein [Oscillospiraceae bacterium]
MANYTIMRRPEPMCWEDIPHLNMEYEYRHREHNIRAWAQLCYDDQALYIRLQAVEPEIRAEHHGPLGEICEDSCLEFFFSPIPDDDRYFNLEVNPNGAMFKGFGTNVHTLQRLIPEEAFVVPSIAFTEDGWVAEYAIPYEFIRLFFPDFSPAPGRYIRANCYKCGNLSPHPHWLCWAPVPEEAGTFHRPDLFGTMYFG